MKKMIVANWKMNPQSSREAREIFKVIKRKSLKSKLEIAICPPILYLETLEKLNKNKKILLGAQDFFQIEKGSWTGKVSFKMLKNSGVDLSLLGHSELISLGETNMEINSKLKTVLKNKSRAVLCIGENKRDTEGLYFSILEKQLNERLAGIGPRFIEKVTIAYEPLWAIGEKAKKVVKVEELLQISIFIRKILADKYGAKKMSRIKILYGGSVNPRNAQALIEGGSIDGFLLGRASLKSEDFIRIMGIVEAS